MNMMVPQPERIALFVGHDTENLRLQVANAPGTAEFSGMRCEIVNDPHEALRRLCESGSRIGRVSFAGIGQTPSEAIQSISRHLNSK